MDKFSYDPYRDIWQDCHSRLYIKNEFLPHKAVFICVSDELWSANWQGTAHYIDWRSLPIPAELKPHLKEYVQSKLKSNCVEYLSYARNSFKDIFANWSKSWPDFSSVKLEQFVDIWAELKEHYRSFLREMYSSLAQSGLAGAKMQIAVELSAWKARNEIQHLKEVVSWNPQKGALTRAEEKVFMEVLCRPQGVCPKSEAVKISCRIALETGKRMGQILQISKNGLRSQLVGSETKYYLSIPRIKCQTGTENSWWPITSDLALAINVYRNLPTVQFLQDSHGLLIVWNTVSLIERGQVSIYIFHVELLRFIRGAGKTISPRTNKQLHITSTRLRHTVGTRLAFNGAPQEVIQFVLEHDHEASAKAYIDASMSEMHPEVMKADRNMGECFDMLSKCYFKGTFADEVGDQVIVVPSTNARTPLIVGECGRDVCTQGPCNHHPFFSCYNGCPNFLAWREQDHNLALKYVDQEIEKLEVVRGHKDKKHILTSYSDTRRAILEVIEVTSAG